MTISYCSHYEGFDDSDDDTFFVGMTPDGPVNFSCETQDEFWEWYCDGDKVLIEHYKKFYAEHLPPWKH